MDIFYYVLHRFYNGFRWFYAPSLTRYRRYKIVRKVSNKISWKENKYHLVDK